MNMTTETVEEIRELVSNNQIMDLNSVKIQAVSVAAALELACCRAEWQEDTHVTELLNCWASQAPILALAFGTLDSGSVPAREDIFGSREFEFFPIAGRR